MAAMASSLIVLAMCCLASSTENVHLVDGTCDPDETVQARSARALLQKSQKREIQDGVLEAEESVNSSETGSGCPSWCTTAQHLKRHPWEKKCWLYQCQYCDDWKANCGAVHSDGPLPKCAGWCVPHSKTRRGKPNVCKWVNCMGCSGWFEKCKPSPDLIGPDASKKPYYSPKPGRCAPWCTDGSARHLKNHPWERKCWLVQCQDCSDWKANCYSKILKEGSPPKCAGWCERHSKTTRGKPNQCKWVNCMGCNGWKEKCEEELLGEFPMS